METQPLGKVLQGVQQDLRAKATNATHSEKPMVINVPRPAAMRKLWERMSAIYGHRWTSAYDERCDDENGVLTVPGETWQRGLAGVSDQSIGKGISACIVAADPWPPTLPQFRGMCLDVPTLAAARAEFSDQSTNFAIAMKSSIDSWAFRHATAEQANRMIRDAYEVVREEVMRNGETDSAPAIDHERARIEASHEN